MAWEPFHNSSVEIWKILQLHTECVKKTCSAAPFEYHSRLEAFPSRLSNVFFKLKNDLQFSECG